MTRQAPPVLLAALEPLRLVGGLTTELHSGKAQARRPVIVYPGLATAAWATSRLRRYLGDRGHDVHDWGQGFNCGPTGSLSSWLKPMRLALRELADKHGQPVSLIGWSLGGLYARELAKLERDSVAQVITLGTPIESLGATNVAPLFWALNALRFKSAESLPARLRRTPPVPTTSIYCRDDGIVAWTASKASARSGVRNIELAGVGHLGLVTHAWPLACVARLIEEA